MGIYDRDYMRKPQRGASSRSGSQRHRFGAPQAPRSTVRWSHWLAWVTALIVAVVGFRFFFQWRDGQPFPESGTAHWFIANLDEPRVAQLMLTAPARTRQDFAVRLDDWASGAPVVLIHVRGGESSVTLMPLGRYRVTIAKGTRWLGTGRLFGMGGEVREAVDPLEFYRREREVTGHRIELETLVGNMETRPGRW